MNLLRVSIWGESEAQFLTRERGATVCKSSGRGEGRESGYYMFD